MKISIFGSVKEVWLFPAEIESLIGKVRFSRLGIKLAESHNKGYRWQHEATIALACPTHAHAFELCARGGGVVSRSGYLSANTPAADDVLGDVPASAAWSGKTYRLKNKEQLPA